MNFNKCMLLIYLFIFSQMGLSDNWQFDAMKLKSVNQGYQVNFNSIKTPLSSEVLKNIEFKCNTSQQIFPSLNCENGSLSFKYQHIHYFFLFTGRINLSTNAWDITLTNSEHNIQIVSQSKNPNILLLKLDGVSSKQLEALISPHVEVDLSSISANISAQLKIKFAKELTVRAKYKIQKLNWESDDGNYVLAESQIEGQFEYQQDNHSAFLSLSSYFTAGEALFDNVYLLFSEAQIATNSQLFFDDKLNVTSHKLDIIMNEVNQMNLHLDDIFNGSFDIDFTLKDLKQLKTHELDSYLEILGINDLDIIGQASGTIEFENNRINTIDATLKDVSFEIASKKTEALDLNAQLHWQATGAERISVINWKNLLIAGMPIQESELQISTVGGQLTVTPETTVPIFDGDIIIHQLALDKVFEPQIDIVFDGEVTPVSLALITEKMNWPIMQGSISGKIPGMKKQGQSISFDGSLDINVFDGIIQIDHLSMERLLGIAPVIAADVTFQNLNLQQITSTYDFGEITGLINGTVKGLRITNWKADRLEASIESVPSQKIKQTISQRAIDNISSIGGIQGALSRSFLRFFDSFKYKKIGIGCKLRNSICEMSGIKTSDNTYKLIEGRGIPSINIIGFQKFIDWEVFLDRLLNAGY